jgi:predicted secreted protein
MIRSRRIVLVPFCTLAQGIRAEGIVRDYPAVVHPVVKFLSDNNINIHQMPCPELFFDKLRRPPKQKKAYSSASCQKSYHAVAESVAKFVEMYKTGGYEVLAIMGIDFSPSCAINLITAPPPNRIIPGQGYFTEALSHALRSRGIVVPLIGIKTRKPQEAVAELQRLIGGKT